MIGMLVGDKHRTDGFRINVPILQRPLDGPGADAGVNEDPSLLGGEVGAVPTAPAEQGTNARHKGFHFLTRFQCPKYREIVP